MSDRKMIHEQKVTRLQRQLAEDSVDTDQDNKMLKLFSQKLPKIRCLPKNQMLTEGVQKLKRYKTETIRRKFNYLPFIMELFKTLAEYQQ